MRGYRQIQRNAAPKFQQMRQQMMQKHIGKMEMHMANLAAVLGELVELNMAT